MLLLWGQIFGYTLIVFFVFLDYLSWPLGKISSLKIQPFLCEFIRGSCSSSGESSTNSDRSIIAPVLIRRKERVCSNRERVKAQSELILLVDTHDNLAGSRRMLRTKLACSTRCHHLSQGQFIRYESKETSFMIRCEIEKIIAEHRCRSWNI